MNMKSFVSSIKIVACHSVVRGIVDMLRHPPGRRPDSKLVEAGEWYCKLGQTDIQMVNTIMQIVAEQAVYNVLLVLDGKIALEERGPKGRFEVYYCGENDRILLNDPSNDELTASFKAND